MMRIDYCAEGAATRTHEAEALLVRLAPGAAFGQRLCGEGLQVLNTATDAVLVVVEGDENLRRQLRDEIGAWPEVRQISSLFFGAEADCKF